MIDTPAADEEITMNQKTYNHPSQWLARGRIAILAAIILISGLATAAGAQDAQPVTAADSEQAKQNLALFGRLDFEAWNNRDWDLFRKLHAENVKVGGLGQKTENVADHIAWAQAYIKQFPDSKITAHPIRIGAGEWTAVTGVFNGGSTMATIARWKNGQVG